MGKVAELKETIQTTNESSEVVKELSGKKFKYQISKHDNNRSTEGNFGTSKWDEDDKKWYAIHHSKGVIFFKTAGDAEKALKSYINKWDK